MKRLLVVAGDKALTRFVTEALLERALGNGTPRTQDPWEVARAHSGIEAFLLMTKGGRTFDVILVDQELPDQDPLELLDKLRKSETARAVPIFLMSERGRDQHSRRIASEHYGVAAFIEKPVTAETLRSALGNLERKRRVLLVEPSPDIGDRYRSALTDAGYLTELAGSGRDALERAARFRPDVVISALALEDMRGADVCIELKKGRVEIPVVLYGNVSALASQEITENAYRADDFVQAPFDEGVLVERIASLVGRGVSEGRRRRPAPAPPPPAEDTVQGPAIDDDLDDQITNSSADRNSGNSGNSGTSGGGGSGDLNDRPPAAPPPSASPKAVGPTKRSTRRVPCQISMSIRNGERVYTSKTLDISHGGIFLATEEALEIGTLLDMTFQIPNSPRVVNAVGKVAWIEKTPDGVTPTRQAGVGVKFSKIEPSDLQLIVDYVNRVARVVYSAS